MCCYDSCVEPLTAPNLNKMINIPIVPKTFKAIHHDKCFIDQPHTSEVVTLIDDICNMSALLNKIHGLFYSSSN